MKSKDIQIISIFTAVLLICCTSVCADMTAIVLNVGQGDAILVSSAEQHLLFDAGPAQADVASKVQSYGVTELDYFITSHPDTDHIGGAVKIIDTIPIGTYADSGVTHTTLAYRNMMLALANRNITYTQLLPGKSFMLGDVHVDVLASGGTRGDNNAGSVVLKLTDGDVTMILPGDREHFDNWPAKVLVVPHHGSAASNIERVNPKVAIISVGAGNLEGLPARGTLNKIENMGIELYRTDKDGPIGVISDGSSYTVVPGIMPVITKRAQISTPTSTPTQAFTATPTQTLTATPTPTRTLAPTPTRTQTPMRTLAPALTREPTPAQVGAYAPVPCSCDMKRYDCCDFQSQGVAQRCYEECLMKTGRDVHGINPHAVRACGTTEIATRCGWRT
jgi:competence protein ComEC